MSGGDAEDRAKSEYAVVGTGGSGLGGDADGGPGGGADGGGGGDGRDGKEHATYNYLSGEDTVVNITLGTEPNPTHANAP